MTAAFLSYQLFRRQNKQHCRDNTTKSFLVLGKIIYHIDLSNIPAFSQSKNPSDDEIGIVLETLANLHRNWDKKVTARDWPIPCEFSERKSEFDKKWRKLSQSQEVEMEVMNENYG